MRDFGDDVFAGTAKYYAKYRVAYPPQLFNDIVRKFNLNGQGQLLDLGSGSGEIAIPLAKYFEKVLALDPDQEMLNEGQKKAMLAGANNISWQRASSKGLTGVKDSFRVVAMGQSFHWMDTTTIIKQLYSFIETGGGLVIIGTSKTPQNKLSTAKELAIKGLINRYLGPKRRAGKYFYEPTGEKWEEELFPSSSFGEFEKSEYIVQVNRTVDQVIGNLFSMSWASKKLLGKRAENFENELRVQLKAISKNGQFIENTKFILYVLKK